jgi:hypothetical protein
MIKKKTLTNKRSNDNPIIIIVVLNKHEFSCFSFSHSFFTTYKKHINKSNMTKKITDGFARIIGNTPLNTVN